MNNTSFKNKLIIARILKKYLKYAKMQQSNRVTGWVDLYSL